MTYTPFNYRKILWEKRHIINYKGEEFDIWVFYTYENNFKRQICVCETEDQFNAMKKNYNLK